MYLYIFLFKLIRLEKIFVFFIVCLLCFHHKTIKHIPMKFHTTQTITWAGINDILYSNYLRIKTWANETVPIYMDLAYSQS